MLVRGYSSYVKERPDPDQAGDVRPDRGRLSPDRPLLRDLVLIVTDASAPAGLGRAALGSLSRLPAAELVRARGAKLAHTTDWWEAVGAVAGIRMGNCAVAEIAWLGATAQRREAIWCATPVRLTAAIDHVRLEAVGAGKAEALQSVVAGFNREFGDGGFLLHATQGGHAFLEMPRRMLAASFDPGRIVGQDIADRLPTGADAPLLRRLMTEIQMWLHARRVADAAFNALWLWGGGGTWPEPADGELPVAASPEPLVRGLWRLWSGQCIEPPANFAAASRLPARALLATLSLEDWRAQGEGRPLERLDREWLAPAWRALQRGRLATLTLNLNGELTRVTRAQRWRFWRARHHWADS